MVFVFGTDRGIRCSNVYESLAIIQLKGETILAMVECIAPPSLLKPYTWRSCAKKRSYGRYGSNPKTSQRNYWNRSCRVLWHSTSSGYKLCTPGISIKEAPLVREASLRCLGSVCNPDAVDYSDWLLVGDQLLLMTSVFLTYMTGVIPIQKSNFTPQKMSTKDNLIPESSTSSGSKKEQVNSYAWDTLKAKLLDTLDSFEQWNNLKVIDIEHHTKRPLSLYALAEGPKLRLLCASFQRLEEEVNQFLGDSEKIDMDGWLTAFPKVISKSCLPVCTSWLKKEFCLGNSNIDKSLTSLMIEKLKGDDTVLQNIRMSGKEVLYAELLYFLRFESLRKGCCYDHSLFIVHAEAILEDLIITFADGIAGSYLEVISVDGNSPDEMNGMISTMCNLSTRALQKLRNEVALNQWMYQNVQSVVSMFEDCFDLCILQLVFIEEPNLSQPEKSNWWRKFTMGNSRTASPSFRYAMIVPFSMPVKRTMELRALLGWRYYLSLYLELADISLPLIKAVIGKISSAISFFLVTLIGRSLGLIYTGIRQSLRWK